MRLKKLCAAVALSVSLLAVAPSAASAATATASLLVSATVLSFCTIAATPMAFGNYASVVLNISANLTVACTNTTSYNIGLNAGTGTGATVTNRLMTNGLSTLQYKLTSDSSHTTNIGQTIGSDTITGTGNGSPQIITIYGQIPAGQLATTGLYNDTVVATITY